ncbi:MAG: hypothetical protein RLW87_12480 [Alphaproteobacteria bacterium]
MIGWPMDAGPCQCGCPEVQKLLLRTLNGNLSIPLIAAEPLL